MISKNIKQVFNFKDRDIIAVLVIIVLHSIVSSLYFAQLMDRRIFPVSIFLSGIFIGLITGIGQRKFWHGIIYIYICIIIVFVIIPIAWNPDSIENLFTPKGYFYWTNIFMVISTKYYLLVHFLTKVIVVGLKSWYRKVS